MLSSISNLLGASNSSYTITKGQTCESNVQVNPNTTQPDRAWKLLKDTFEHRKIENPMPLDTPIYEDKVRFVCISDTHSLIDKMRHTIPSGDVLLHAGDFSFSGEHDEVKQFSEFLKGLDAKFKHKVVIAGNHELSFDPECLNAKFSNKPQKSGQEPRELVQNCIYLEDSMVELFGIKIYGSPWQPRFCDWAFNADRGEDILKVWNKIPNNVDVLITHGPPLGFGDTVVDGFHVGCCELLATIRERVRPKFHVFGHIHEDHGVWTDNVTTYINASICNSRYKPVLLPVLFDIPLPKGVTK